jgi:hypothetical protein
MITKEIKMAVYNEYQTHNGHIICKLCHVGLKKRADPVPEAP